MADKQVKNLTIQLQNGTDRTVYATWNFDSTANKKLDHYDVHWMYRVKGNDIWFKEGESTEQYKQSLYSPPSNATKVKVKVKPVAKEVQNGSKSSPAWTGSWVTSDVFTIPEKEVIDSDGPGDEDVPTPPTPSINIDSNGIMVAAVENYKVDGARVCIDVWMNDGKDGASNIATLNAKSQVLEGTILVGSDSTLTLNLTNNSSFKGTVSGKITNAKGKTVSSDVGTVNVKIDGSSIWTLTGNTYITSLEGDVSQINMNGYKLYVGGKLVK